MNRRKFWNVQRRAFCWSVLGIPLLYCTAMAQRPAAQAPKFPVQFPIPPPGQQDNIKPSVLKMRVEGGKVTAEIRDCPLQKVLSELADRTGIIFEVRSQENPQVSIALQETPLQEAIQRIASGSNTIFFYSESAPGPQQIAMVRIFSRAAELIQPGIVYLGTGAVTKSGDILETPEQAMKVLAESADVRERQNAVEVLAASGKSEAVVQVLTKAVSDPAPEIRVAAIEGLVALDARSALPAVLRCLKDAHPGVRQSAAAAVGLLGSAENLKELKTLAVDKDAAVAAAAELAMRRLSAAAKKID